MWKLKLNDNNKERMIINNGGDCASVWITKDNGVKLKVIPMKTEYQKLKLICDKIGFENNYQFMKDWIYCKYWEYIRINVREIIFTPDFFEKLECYIFDLTLEWINNDDWELKLLQNLDNPVSYLSNLLEEWTIKKN